MVQAELNNMYKNIDAKKAVKNYEHKKKTLRLTAIYKPYKFINREIFPIRLLIRLP